MTPEDLALQMSRMKERFAELDAQLADPGIYARQYECRVLSAERRRLGELFRLHDDWTKALRELHENRELLQTEQDESFRNLLLNDISELEQQLQGQAAVLPEGRRAEFTERAEKTIHSLRRAANGAVPQEERTSQVEQRTAHPVPASREPAPDRAAQAPRQAEGGESPRQSVKVKIRRLKQEQARRPQRPKVRLTPER